MNTQLVELNYKTGLFGVRSLRRDGFPAVVKTLSKLKVSVYSS